MEMEMIYRATDFSGQVWEYYNEKPEPNLKAQKWVLPSGNTGPDKCALVSGGAGIHCGWLDTLQQLQATEGGE